MWFVELIYNTYIGAENIDGCSAFGLRAKVNTLEEAIEAIKRDHPHGSFFVEDGCERGVQVEPEDPRANKWVQGYLTCYDHERDECNIEDCDPKVKKYTVSVKNDYGPLDEEWKCYDCGKENDVLQPTENCPHCGEKPPRDWDGVTFEYVLQEYQDESELRDSRLL